jgi:hypothetical protein
MILTGKLPKYLEKNMSLCHSVHNKSNVDFSMIETGLQMCEVINIVSLKGCD